jgi:flagellar FliJ protein
VPFRFRLQRIYDVRRKEEETLKNDLSKINEKVENTQRIIQQLSAEKKRIESNFLHKKVLRKEDLLNMEMQMMFYEEEIKKKQSELSELMKEQEKTRSKLFEKMKERKILEKLKERKMREYFREENLKERKTMDEIAERKFWWES